MIQQAIKQVINQKSLSLPETRSVMDEIMQGQATNAQIAAFLIAMNMKGETIDEITACALSLREHGIKLQREQDVMEIVGTGGDNANTFNISTTTALVVAAAGIPVAKHGNRSVSSRCGSADVLEALGVNIDISPQKSQQLLSEIGICFMFAQKYHTSMKYAAPVRKELGVHTLFNIVGPLTNPASANMQLLGVYDENMVEPMAKVLHNLGIRRAMVVHGHDGVDEASMTGKSTVCEVDDGRFNSFFLDPRQYGFSYCRPEDLVGGDAEENAEITRQILGGRSGPQRDVVLLNAGLCLYMANSDHTLRDCVKMAESIIDSGKARAKLEEFVRRSNDLG